LKLQELSKDEILKVPCSDSPDSTVYVVLNGKIALRDHQLDDPHDYNLIAVAKQGSIIGAKQMDMGFSSQSTVWAVVQSSIANVCSMSQATFDILLRKSHQREQEIT
jgi:hypothetical protein